jgi:hypothetical protein
MTRQEAEKIKEWFRSGCRYPGLTWTQVFENIDSLVEEEKSCDTCEWNGNQHLLGTACTGCLSGEKPANWQPKNPFEKPTKYTETPNTIVSDNTGTEQPKKIRRIGVRDEMRLNAISDWHKTLTVIMADGINRIIDHLNGEGE